jgi:hypothetical protein
LRSCNTITSMRRVWILPFQRHLRPQPPTIFWWVDYPSTPASNTVTSLSYFRSCLLVPTITRALAT